MKRGKKASQAQKFKDAAIAVEADQSQSAMDRAMKQVVTGGPASKPKAKATKKRKAPIKKK